jgi:hypothetical protein
MAGTNYLTKLHSWILFQEDMMGNTFQPVGNGNNNTISKTLGIDGTFVGNAIDLLAATAGLDKLLGSDSPIDRFGTAAGSQYIVKSGDTLD